MARAVRPCQVELRNEIAPKRTWTVKLERSGRDHSLRIPGEVALPGEEAVLRRDGDKVVVELVGKEKSIEKLIAYFRSIPPITEEFPKIDDPPPEDVEF